MIPDYESFEIVTKAERAGDSFQLRHHHAGYGGEGGGLAGLGDAHVGPDA
jgi:hypothetical protein